MEQQGERVARFLYGLEFPASKQECIDYAREHDAPLEVIEVLDCIPNRRYLGLSSVWEAVESEAE